MGIRKIDFVNDEYYHVFNRGVDKRKIFTTKDEMYFFFNRLSALNNTDSSKKTSNKRNYKKDSAVFGDGDKLVKIVAYCLLPNHFHLLLKQQSENGISIFMQRLGTSYTKFFNDHNDRTGSLFQGKFKASHLSGEFALPTLSAYVNLNYKHHKIDPRENLVKTSLFEYFNEELGVSICDKDEVSNIIKEADGLDNYKKYIKQASMAFANNKNIILDENLFEF